MATLALRSPPVALPPLLDARPPAAQAVLIAVAPATLGAVTGIALGLSAVAYLVLNVLAAVGGILAGLEHAGARWGALRGLLGGLLFGTFILIANWASGMPPTTALPQPEALLPLITLAVGIVLGALGGLLRGRRARPRPSRP